MGLSISIITPSFNQVQYLEQTIDSVLSQNYAKLEYIVIDGGSTDGSVELIKKYEKHLAYWISEKDNGQSHAINKGLQMATGEVINWLNSDDFYQPNALQYVAEVFSNPSTKAICARSNIVKDGIVVKQSTGTDIYEGNLAKTIGWARIDQPETFFRLSAYKTVGFLNEKFHYVMDREWWIRYLFQFGLEGIVKSDDILVNFRLHDFSKTESKKPDFERENFQLYKTMAELAGIGYMFNVFDEPNSGRGVNLDLHPITRNKDLMKKVISYFLLLKADQEYYTGNLKTAIKILSIIDRNLFTEEDQKLMGKIQFRSRYVPETLLKVLRIWR